MNLPSVDLVDMAGILGALAVIGAAIKYTFLGLRSIYKSLETISKIYDELKPNGGSSIKDAIARIEKKQIDLDFHQSLLGKKFYALLQETPACLFETDAKGRYVWVSKNLSHLLDKTPEELQGFSWLTNVSPNDRATIEKEWFQAIKQQREYDATHTVTVDTNTIKIRCTAWPLLTTRGLEGYMGTYTVVK